MPACHICGAVRESLFKSWVEMTSISVCEDCSRFGKTIESPKILQSNWFIANKVEEIEIVERDYFLKIKNAREKRGLTHGELAKLLAERESSLHHIETGKLKPTIELAKKIEKTLGITIISKDYIGGNVSKKNSSNASLTIGDIVKFKHDK